jgi:hypothetical protein
MSNMSQHGTPRHQMGVAESHACANWTLVTMVSACRPLAQQKRGRDVTNPATQHIAADEMSSSVVRDVLNQLHAMPD